MSRFPFRVPEKLSLEGLQSEVSSLIERWWHCGLSTGPLDGQDWAPPTELRDEPDCYRVVMELPGVDRSTIDLTARAASLVIRGEKLAPPTAPSSEGAEAPAVRVLQTERRYGGFRRTIALPGPIRIDATSAVLRDGVLEVTLPKAASPDPTEVHVDIDVQASQGKGSTAIGS